MNAQKSDEQIQYEYDPAWDLNKVVARLIRFRDERDWFQFHRPKEIAAAIAIEAAELQELFLWKDPETAADVCSDPQRMQRIAEEISDIGIFLLFAAVELEIPLSEAINDKLDRDERRYNVRDHFGVAKKADNSL